MKRSTVICAAVLLLAACGREEAAVTSQPAPAAPVPPVSAPAPASPWSMQASTVAGSALVLSDAAGREQLRIACRRNPADLWVQTPSIAQIGSEERLTLGAGDELATLVVSQETPPGRPMEAAGQLTEPFIAAFEAGRPIGVSYGATQLGPLDPPAPDMRAAFAASCRQALQ